MNTTPSAALAPEQLRSALWADPAVHVHALLIGARLPGLPARLAQAQAASEIEDHDCLWPGALEASRRERAPWLVRLRRDRPFADWVLSDAARVAPDWGVLLRSGERFLDLRGHARALGQAALVDGRAVALEWMDPAVLRVLLPLAPRDQLDDLFAPLASLSWTEGGEWLHCNVAAGKLHATRHGTL